MALATALTSGARTVIDARSRALLDTDPGIDADRRLALELLADAAPRLANPATLWEPLLRDVRQLDGFERLVRDWGLVDYWRAYGWPDFCHELDGGDFECR